MRHLIILAKAPRLGRAKRRLAADIGPVEALRFYRANLARTVRRLGRGNRWKCWLFIDDGNACWPEHLPRRRQRRGDLGQRMDAALRSLPPGPVVLIGSDIPGVTPSDIRDAFRQLAGKDAVFGPAADGGYWLVGIAHAKAVTGLFRDVRWSSKHALSDTVRNLSGASTYGLTIERHDVDDGPAYARWRGTVALQLKLDWSSTLRPAETT
jgi:rSAM/selenodomain-associated transferase 1